MSPLHNNAEAWVCRTPTQNNNPAIFLNKIERRSHSSKL